jgi:hypothetical protein
VLVYGGRELAADRNTEAEATEAVIDILVGVLEAEEDARPAPAPTWEEVAAASKAQQDAAEVARLAAEQAQDDTATKKRTLKTGAAAKKDGLKNGGLKVPAGHKRKKAAEKGIEVEVHGDGAGDTKLYAGFGEDLKPVNKAAREAEGVLCAPTCELAHDHTDERTAF